MQASNDLYPARLRQSAANDNSHESMASLTKTPHRLRRRERMGFPAVDYKKISKIIFLKQQFLINSD